MRCVNAMSHGRIAKNCSMGGALPALGASRTMVQPIRSHTPLGKTLVPIPHTFTLMKCRY